MTAPEVNGADMADLKAEFASLKDKVTSLESEMTRQYSNLEAEVRITKHDVINLTQMLNGFSARMEKMEERLAQKIDGISADFTKEVRTLAAGIAAVNVKQERGTAYVAGVMCAAGVVGGMLMLLAKFLFQGVP